MKKTIALILALITTISIYNPVYADDCIQPIKVQINIDYSKRKPTSNTTSNKTYSYTPRTSNKSLDEYRVNKSAQAQKESQNKANKSVKVTNTADELHIYSDTYGTEQRSYGSKMSTDEFHTAPVDIEANDGYKHGNFDELHINENYVDNVWKPDHEILRINGFDEFHLPNEL